MRLGYRRQRGATLIVMLILLLFITIMGILAIRTAMTSLNIATNSQIGQLLVQTGDTPTNQFLNVATYDALKKADIVIGAALLEHKNAPGKEFIFCYRPTSGQQMGAAFDATILVPPAQTAAADTKATIDSTQSNRSGFCDLQQDFGSAREAVVTQVAVRIPTDSANAGVGAYLERNSDLSENSIVKNSKADDSRVRITITSILPNYSTEDLAVVQAECIGSATAVGYINDTLDEDVAGKKTMADCLTGYGIPVNTQVQEIVLRQRDKQIAAPIPAP
ncbi:pilus assembly PilX family protein [Acinetobacter tjernbergiae]|uniref:Type 4 fimbrial biogenesis protein PilX N-terminal domain-containing protein n=1 Tax=Acinetobacter tjernbergiae DSM 14971 = CIP 107465 TaxID=1120928 RepID=V2V0G8_9GAMM|nr:hypothetical protein [Acinetobacter tjernbergiae]ESK54395.1 hypothetical protein F990_02754 [Acinetobacter tjernbergiae DSM 14971 = CIP 107465]